ncbi:flippase [Marinococcus halotolerans]|uniref:flippase n=1 Tax=Marinococcus halotolerans TaxID=301092 RepID=UPI0003B4EE9C|nr:flippase [Marinococcus halotolerans]
MKNQQTRPRSTVFDIITSFGTRILLLFGTFISSVIMARVLGPEGQGIVTAVFVLPNIIYSLADLGVRQSAAYFTGKQIYSVDTINSAVLSIWLFTTAATTAVVGLYFYFSMSDEYDWLVLLIALASLPLKLFHGYYKGILHGKNRIGAINLGEIIKANVQFFGVILLVALLGFGVRGGALVQFLIPLGISLYFLIQVNTYVNWKFRLDYRVIWKICKRGIPYALALFLLTLNYKIDIFILRYLVEDDQIGLYSVGTNMAELVWQLPIAIGLVLFAKGATSTNEQATVRRAVKVLRVSYPVIIVICTGIIVLAPILIRLLYGEVYVPSATVLQLLMPGVIALCVAKVLHPDMSGRGYPLYAIRAFTLPLIINIVLNFMLIPGLGINGAAIASTISYIIGAVVYARLYARKEQLNIKDILIIKKADIAEIAVYAKKKYAAMRGKS